MHVLMSAMPFGGHQPPMRGIAAELVRRGHRVTYYTGAKYRDGAERDGATWLPWRQATDFDANNLAAAFPTMRRGRGLGAVLDSFGQLFFGTGPEQLADVSRLHGDDPVDLVISEDTCVAGSFLHDARAVPWVGVALGLVGLSSRHQPPAGFPLSPGRGRWGRGRDAALRATADVTFNRWMLRRLNEARARAGLAPTTTLDSLYSRRLHLCQGVAGLDYPRPDAPEFLQYIGDAAVGTRTGTEPEWFADLDPTRPLVHVTAGTLDTTSTLVERTVTALAGTPAQVVAGGDPALVPPAANVIAPGWVPHDLLLPRTSVVVTNGGFGAVLASLSHGVPLVVAPGGEDKPMVARRVAHAGAGLDLRRAEPSPARIRAAVEACLGDSEYRRAARSLADEFAVAGGAARGADLIEASMRA